jgi:hypothetical protein
MTKLRYGRPKDVVRLPARTVDSFLYQNAHISYIETCKSDCNINIVTMKYIHIYMYILLDVIKTFYSVT